jgi:hypothetical protein
MTKRKTIVTPCNVKVSSNADGDRRPLSGRGDEGQGGEEVEDPDALVIRRREPAEQAAALGPHALEPVEADLRGIEGGHRRCSRYATRSRSSRSARLS